MSKLRLLLFEECNRSCDGCCNKDWDLKSLPVCKDYSPYDEIMLTGGEPMLCPVLLYEVIKEIRKTSKAKIYIYTAMLNDPAHSLWLLRKIDGLTVTLHSQSDADCFLRFTYHPLYDASGKSLRLNIFKDITLHDKEIPSEWIVKKDIEWIKDCPLPKDEIFMRLGK